jgi:hypothetical protein
MSSLHLQRFERTVHEVDRRCPLADGDGASRELRYSAEPLYAVEQKKPS